MRRAFHLGTPLVFAGDDRGAEGAAVGCDGLCDGEHLRVRVGRRSVGERWGVSLWRRVQLWHSIQSLVKPAVRARMLELGR